MATEALFYHLTARSLEQVLPEMLEKCLERGWTVTVRAGSPERVAALGGLLWSWRDDAFLPHGDATDGRGDRQPIWLTYGPDMPNAPHALFLVDGAGIDDAELGAAPRLVAIFDGADDAAVAEARALWRRAQAAGCACVYWAQDDQGRWVKRAG